MVDAPTAVDDPVSELEVQRLLNLVCTELGMDGGLIGRFAEGKRTIRYAFGPDVEPGGSDPLEESYCKLVVDGTVPSVVRDTSDFPVLQNLEVTQRLHIGSHLGLALVLPDGTLYGSLCAYRRQPSEDLGEVDVRVLRLVARLVGHRLEAEVLAERNAEEHRRTVKAALERGEPAMVFQPIVEIESRRPVGFEALARFSGEPYRTPDVWIADATAAGLGIEVELRAIEHALAASSALPAGLYLSVNASARVVMTGRLPDLLSVAQRPMVVEVTEHERAEGPVLRAALAQLRSAGHRIALDDAGAGYAGLSQVLELKPEVMKIDRNLVTGIDSDPVRQAMAGAGTMFAAALAGALVAEGVETEEEAAELRRLGVTFGQGYLFGRPAPADTWSAHTPSVAVPPSEAGGSSS